MLPKIAFGICWIYSISLGNLLSEAAVKKSGYCYYYHACILFSNLEVRSWEKFSGAYEELSKFYPLCPNKEKKEKEKQSITYLIWYILKISFYRCCHLVSPLWFKIGLGSVFKSLSNVNCYEESQYTDVTLYQR